MSPNANPSDAELDKIIREQRQLMDNIEKLEKASPGNQSWSTRFVRSLQRNRSGAAVVLMSASCGVMALSMLGNKKKYEAKSEELNAALKQAESDRASAEKEAAVSAARLENLRAAVLREVRNGGWGMASRLEQMATQAPDEFIADAQDSTAPGTDHQEPDLPKVQPKMI